MKAITTTHIDTGGHGYYSVSKKDIKLLGIENEISGFSGQSLNRVYLEEDCDGTLLYEKAKQFGYELKRKSGYNLKFGITHNYNPALFGWVPKLFETIIVGEKTEYTIYSITNSAIFVKNDNGNKYKIPKSNPFKYITGIK